MADSGSDIPDAKDPEAGLTVVELARERYAKGEAAYKTTRQQALEDTKFVMGDSDNGWQWPDDIQDVWGEDSTVRLTINLTAQHCNQVINGIRQNRPAARVLPVDSGADKRTAEIMGGLIRNIQVSSNADDAHDVGAEHAIYGGEGYWRIVTEYESEDSFDQVIKIKPVSNPNMVVIDPSAQEIDKSDAEWGFVAEEITKTRCRREHPKVDPSSWIKDSGGWVKEDTVIRAEYFYVDWIDDEALLMMDGTSMLKSQAEEQVKLGAIRQDYESVVKKRRPTKRKKWTWCKLLGGEEEPLDVKEWLGSYLPIVSVVGKEVNVNGEIIRKGLVRDLKDAARMVNYSYSAAVTSIALQNDVPYIASVEATEGLEEDWDTANTRKHGRLRWNARDKNGNELPKPERQAPVIMPTAQVQMLELSISQMRAVSGQQNSNFGIRSEAQSGIGIQRLKQQGEVATFHFPDNLTRALKYESKILLDLIPKYIDTRRVVRILGLDGRAEQATLDPQAQQAYAEEMAGAEQDIQKIFNPTLGKYDVVIDTGPSYQTQRTEAYANLSELAGKNPKLMDVAGDLVFRAADFPMAEQLAERWEKTLPPGLADQKGQQQIPPPIQAHLQQTEAQMGDMAKMLDAGQAELQRLEQENQALKVDKTLEAQKIQAEADKARVEAIKAQAEAQNRSRELDIEMFRADTERKTALANAQQAEMQAAAQVMNGAAQSPEPMQQPAPLAPITIVMSKEDDGASENLGQQAMALAMESLARAISAPRATSFVRDENGRPQGIVSGT